MRALKWFCGVLGACLLAAPASAQNDDAFVESNLLAVLYHELGLPDERLETCAEEFDLAYDSWGSVFDELAQNAPGQSLRYIGGTASLTEQLVAEEVAALNQDFALPEPLTISVQACDEPNAFYDPERREIVMCSEFEDWLRSLPIAE